MNKDDLDLLQKRICELTIGPSTLRNQGAPGVISATRKYLLKIDLDLFSLSESKVFLSILDIHTDKLRESLPPGARNWGAARKAMNLFLRDCIYNRFLCEHYNLHKIEQWLEVPLDGYVGNALKLEPEGEMLPQWPSIKHLSPSVSEKYQSVARKVAKRLETYPVHLDLRYWRADRRSVTSEV